MSGAAAAGGGRRLGTFFRQVLRKELEPSPSFADPRASISSPHYSSFQSFVRSLVDAADSLNGPAAHAHGLKSGLIFDIYAATAFVSLYSRFGLAGDARKVFDEMPRRNMFTWTAMLNGYVHSERYLEAVQLFRAGVESLELRPDSHAFVQALTACAQLRDLDTGEWIHGVVGEYCLRGNVFVATALVDLYTKCGRIESARAAFDRIREKDMVAWGAMINGYAVSGLPREAVEIFWKMHGEGVRPDCHTLAGALSACASLGTLGMARRAVALISSSEFIANPVLGTVLIDMYAKCGSMGEAWGVFCRMWECDIVACNAVISGLAMTGHERIGFALFAELQKIGVAPNDNTFIGLLRCCNHLGLVEDGRRYFRSMTQIFSIAPRAEHYGCMVDLLSRAGLLDEAHRLIQDMPMAANAVVWGALLGGCKIHRNAELAEIALTKLIELEPRNSGHYVLLSNIYSNSRRWEDTASLRRSMLDKGVEKVRACSWVELDGAVHEFRAGDKSHPLFDQINSKIDELGKEARALGYKPSTDGVFFDVEEEEKEHSLEHHSEKLAIAFCLVATGPEEPIRVVKNLRVCDDCHSAIKFFSRITRREITLRDNNRFHRFADGCCSCNDYW